jgi:hypothetical protein
LRKEIKENDAFCVRCGHKDGAQKNAQNQDVTASGFCYINHLSLLVLAIFSFLTGLIQSIFMAE